MSKPKSQNKERDSASFKENDLSSSGEKKEIKQDALEETVARRKGGTGRRSLIKSSGGGMGFYNKYLS